MRNVLIHTDFSLQSLKLVENAANALNDQTMNIILFHVFDMPAASHDLLAVKKVPYLELLTDEFRNACKRIKNSHSKTINSINIRHLYGNTTAIFRNFVDAHDVDIIVYPTGSTFVPVHPLSLNPEKLFRKSGVPVVHEFTGRSQTRTIPAVEPADIAQPVSENVPELQFEPIPALVKS